MLSVQVIDRAYSTAPGAVGPARHQNSICYKFTNSKTSVQVTTNAFIRGNNVDKKVDRVGRSNKTNFIG